MKSLKILIISCVTLTAFLFTGCSEKPVPLIGREYKGLLFGKPYSIDVVGDSTDYQMQFDSIIHNFEFLFDTNNPNSVVARYNEFQSKGDAFLFVDSTKVFGIVFDLARDLNRHTLYYYDPTTTPLKRAWMVARANGLYEPNLDSLFEFVGFDGARTDLLETDDGNTVLRKSDSRVELDFKDLAQAVALDHISDFLKSKELMQFRIEYDKDAIIHGFGVDDLNILSMGITSDSADLQIRLYDGAFSHISVQDKQTMIDPVNGYPVENEMAYVAVSAPTLAQAKIFAQAFLTMGLEKAKEYYDENEDSHINSYMFYKQDDMLHSASTNGFDMLIIGTGSDNDSE